MLGLPKRLDLPELPTGAVVYPSMHLLTALISLCCVTVGVVRLLGAVVCMMQFCAKGRRVL